VARGRSANAGFQYSQQGGQRSRTVKLNARDVRSGISHTELPITTSFDEAPNPRRNYLGAGANALRVSPKSCWCSLCRAFHSSMGAFRRSGVKGAGDIIG
jgi:hypothetical protein